MTGETIEEAGKAIAPTDREVANAVADTIAREHMEDPPEISNWTWTDG